MSSNTMRGASERYEMRSGEENSTPMLDATVGSNHFASGRLGQDYDQDYDGLQAETPSARLRSDPQGPIGLDLL